MLPVLHPTECGQPFLCYTSSMKWADHARKMGISYKTAWRRWHAGKIPRKQIGELPQG
jgi:hypothetical protein